MTGRPSPPQIIIVHRRQIIVHEAVDVYQLDRRRGTIELRERRSERFPGQVYQRRPKPLARTEDAVAHRLTQPRSAGVR
jgi:hypothetical protein